MLLHCTYSCNSGVQSNKLMIHCEHSGLNQKLLRVKTMVIYIYIDKHIADGLMQVGLLHI